MKNVLLGIYDNIYDVTAYIPKHPGEGIKFVNLREYNGKEVTSDFDKQHLTNEADEILISAKKNGFDEESGIYYVCPFFNFYIKKNKIPSYFYFSHSDPYAKEYLKDKPEKTIILRPSNSERENSLSISYKSFGINQVKIRMVENNKWTLQWENEDGEPEDITKNSVDEIFNYVKERI